LGGSKQKWYIRLLTFFSRLFRKAGELRTRLNNYMKEKYSVRLLSLLTSGAALLICVIALFIPNVLGVADNGSLTEVLSNNGLSYIQTEIEDIYNNYFIREYYSSVTGKGAVNNIQDIFIRLAAALDKLFTNDLYFDIRFLALIYVLLYIPAFYMFINQALCRVGSFTQSVFVSLLGLFIFSDISYISYFNSFYPEAIWYISLLYCVSSMMSIHGCDYKCYGTVILLVFGLILVFTRKQVFFAGFVIAVFCIWQALSGKGALKRVLCLITSISLIAASFISLIYVKSDFTVIDKFHSITKGVLFQAEDSEKALEELGINPSYSVLADVSAYDYYPFVEADAEVLYKGFYDRFTAGDIAIYYLKHPLYLLNMLNYAVSSTVNIRREYCGNYEKSAGMPPKAQSIFWAGWSLIKLQYSPQTLAFLFVLLIAALVFYNGLKKGKESFSVIMVVLAVIGLSQAVIAIIMSGSAAMQQHALIMGFVIDIILFYVVTELVGKVNVI
jgi:hypothetical protein